MNKRRAVDRTQRCVILDPGCPMLGIQIWNNHGKYIGDEFNVDTLAECDESDSVNDTNELVDDTSVRLFNNANNTQRQPSDTRRIPNNAIDTRRVSNDTRRPLNETPRLANKSNKMRRIRDKPQSAYHDVDFSAVDTFADVHCSTWCNVPAYVKIEMSDNKASSFSHKKSQQGDRNPMLDKVFFNNSRNDLKASVPCISENDESFGVDAVSDSSVKLENCKVVDFLNGNVCKDLDFLNKTYVSRCVDKSDDAIDNVHLHYCR